MKLSISLLHHEEEENKMKVVALDLMTKLVSISNSWRNTYFKNVIKKSREIQKKS